MVCLSSLPIESKCLHALSYDHDKLAFRTRCTPLGIGECESTR